MECVKCKKEIEDDSVFCRFCGKKQISERKHKKRANGTGNVTKLSGKRAKPWIARKNGVYIGSYATRGEAQKALDRLTDADVKAFVKDKKRLAECRTVYRGHNVTQEAGAWAAFEKHGIDVKMMPDYYYPELED